jgi:predicted acetyltransferase
MLTQLSFCINQNTIFFYSPKSSIQYPCLESFYEIVFAGGEPHLLLLSSSIVGFFLLIGGQV